MVVVMLAVESIVEALRRAVEGVAVAAEKLPR